MTSIIQVDGLTIEYSNGELKINGKKVDISHITGKTKSNSKGNSFSFVSNKEGKDYEIKDDKEIEGDVTGNISVTGDNVKLIIKGDVTGNITGDCEIKIDGDLVGNVIGGNIKR